MDSVYYKTCRKCGKTKLKAFFYRNGNTRDGLSYRCSECIKKYKKPSELDIINKNLPGSFFKK